MATCPKKTRLNKYVAVAENGNSLLAEACRACEPAAPCLDATNGTIIVDTVVLSTPRLPSCASEGMRVRCPTPSRTLVERGRHARSESV